MELAEALTEFAQALFGISPEKIKLREEQIPKNPKNQAEILGEALRQADISFRRIIDHPDNAMVIAAEALQTIQGVIKENAR